MHCPWNSSAFPDEIWIVSFRGLHITYIVTIAKKHCRAGRIRAAVNSQIKAEWAMQEHNSSRKACPPWGPTESGCVVPMGEQARERERAKCALISWPLGYHYANWDFTARLFFGSTWQGYIHYELNGEEGMLNLGSGYKLEKWKLVHFLRELNGKIVALLAGAEPLTNVA